MSEPKWYCARDGERLGPFDLDQLRQMAAAGSVRPHDLVLREGDQGWRAAADVPGLMPAGSATSPSSLVPERPTPVYRSMTPARVVRWLAYGVLLVLLGFSVRNCFKYGGEIARSKQELLRIEKEIQQIEEKKRLVPPEAVQVRKDQGAFSHDVRLKNVSAVSYGRCDIKLVVYYDRGKRSEFTPYWTTWVSQEEKVVNVPAHGNIERVDLSGTVTDTTSGQQKILAILYEWKPGQAPPAPER